MPRHGLDVSETMPGSRRWDAERSAWTFWPHPGATEQEKKALGLVDAPLCRDCGDVFCGAALAVGTARCRTCWNVENERRPLSLRHASFLEVVEALLDLAGRLGDVEPQVLERGLRVEPGYHPGNSAVTSFQKQVAWLRRVKRMVP